MGKRLKPEEIIAKLREVEIRLARGETAAQAARSIGVTEQTYYRWRKEYGGLQVGQARQLMNANGSRRWSVRTGNCAKPMRSFARRLRILPRRSSTAH